MMRCDNKSVGVIITDENDEYLLLERARYPFGFAPPAGHVDEHGSILRAATTEVYEELGVQLDSNILEALITDRHITNVCRRPGGDYHRWTIYRARVMRSDCQLQPSSAETNGAGWYNATELRELASKTRALDRAVEKADMPALEQVWVHLLDELSLPE